MTPFKLTATLATLLLVAGCSAASAEDTATTPNPTAFRPGWRHEQMMQARAQGQMPPAFAGQRGPGMGYGMGWGYGPALKADGTVDTTKLPEWCPMRTSVQQPQ